ncbi:MAG: EamA family transporter [Solirubrobacteraceae bacterium]
MRDADQLLLFADPRALSSEAVSPRQRNLAVLFAVGSMSSIQLGAALSKPLFPRLGPAGVVMLRLVFAAVVLGVAVRPSLRGRSARELAVPLVLGVASGLLTLAFYEAIARIPLGIAVAIEFTGPLTVALVGSRRWRDGAWVALAAGGIALLTLGHPVSGSLNGVGVLLAFVAAAGWGTYIVLTKRLGESWPGVSGLAVSLAVGALCSLPAGLTHFAHRYAELDKDAFGLVLGLLVPLAPYMLELAALRRLPTRVFGVLMSLEPGIGALLGLLILSQSLALAGVLAIGLIVSASLGVTLTAGTDDPPVPAVID